MTRHRFEGVVTGQCEARDGGVVVGAVVCGLSYAASLHYHDESHPYVSSDPERISFDETLVRTDEPCAWDNQGAGGGWCGRLPGDAVHRIVEVTFEEPRGPEPERTYVQGGAPWASELAREAAAEFVRPVFDAPAEDGGRGDGSSWSFDGFSPTERLAGLAQEVPTIPAEAAERAAWGLQNGQVVSGGPWPVRQYYWGPKDLREAGTEVMEALTLLGEPFEMATWWADKNTCLVRITWGVLYGNADLFEVVRTWP